jgi:TRAP-type transport system small permease protein
MPLTRTAATAALERLSRALARMERAVSLLLLLTVFGLMAAQVIARYMFGRPIAWSEELARLALIWLTFMAASFVMADARHIAVDVVSRALSPRRRVLLECVSAAVVIAACVVLVPAGLQFASQMGPVRSPALLLPMSWWYIAAVLGFALVGLHATINAALTIVRGVPVWDRGPDETGRADPGVLT